MGRKQSTFAKLYYVAVHISLIILCPGFCLNATSTLAASGEIVTVAGVGIGDGLAATSSELYSPTGVAVDSSGDIYIADSGNNRIRKVSASGVITTVAGSGARRYSGDGGDAASAELYGPTGVAVDSSGNIYIADTNNNRVRKVSASGVITTVAGNGTQGYSGDGGDAISAELYTPAGVAVDSSGDIYIADSGNNRIRKVSASGVITTVAGNGVSGYNGDGGASTSAELFYPTGVAVDSSGNIYIADYNVIRKVSASGVITTVAGDGVSGYNGDGGAATSAELNNPTGVALDSLGNIYIADSRNNRIRKVSASGIITTFAGNGVRGYGGDGGAATSAELNNPTGVTVDSSGNIYIAATNNNRIRNVSASGIITTVAGNGPWGYSGDGGAATSAELYYPFGVSVDSLGNIYVADSGNSRIRQLSTSGVITTFAGGGLLPGDGGAATSAALYFPSGVAVDSFGNIYIADTLNNRLRQVSTSGVITTVAGNGTAGYNGDGGIATLAELYSPSGVAADSSDNIYIADTLNNRVRKVSASGVITTVAGDGTAGYSGDGGAATSAELANPSGVALDSLGNIYIADSGNSRIRKVSTSGIITTVAGDGTAGYSGDGGAAISAELNYPTGVAVDSSGSIYIADMSNNRIRKVTTSGVITTVAGDGTWGYSGDGGAATSAELANPSGVALDSLGNIYIADAFNNRIREVFAATSTTVPGVPTGVTAVAGNSEATVSFAAPVSNGGSVITGYAVTSSPAGGVDSDAGTMATTHTITGLANGTAYTFMVSATNSVGTGPASVSSNSVTPAPPIYLQLSAPSAAKAGKAMSFTVTAVYPGVGVETGYPGTVHFASTDSMAILPSDTTLNSGTGTFSAIFKTAGNQTITAADSSLLSIRGSTDKITVRPAAAIHFSVSPPAYVAAGIIFNFTVTALDQFNNRATAYAGRVHFKSTDRKAKLPTNSKLKNGMGSFSAKLKTEGSQTITAKDTVNTSIRGTSNAIDVQ